MNVVQLASPQLQELYQCLEVDFNPLTLCKRVQAVTSQLHGDEQYIPPLQVTFNLLCLSNRICSTSPTSLVREQQAVLFCMAKIKT